jgi:hypothetical protein
VVPSEGRLPILRVTHKSHKNPPSWRYITNASGSILERLNDPAICQLGLEAMEADLGAWADQTKAWFGVAANAYTLVDGTQHVSINLPPMIEHDFCADGNQCFENIPIYMAHPDGVPAVLTRVVALMFCKQRETTGALDPRTLISTAERYKPPQWVNRLGSTSRDHLCMTKPQVLQQYMLTGLSPPMCSVGRDFQTNQGHPYGGSIQPNALQPVSVHVWKGCTPQAIQTYTRPSSPHQGACKVGAFLHVH